MPLPVLFVMLEVRWRDSNMFVCSQDLPQWQHILAELERERIRDKKGKRKFSQKQKMMPKMKYSFVSQALQCSCCMALGKILWLCLCS